MAALVCDLCGGKLVMAAVKKEFEAKIATAQSEAQEKIAPMQNRVNAIINELTMSR